MPRQELDAPIESHVSCVQDSRTLTHSSSPQAAAMLGSSEDQLFGPVRCVSISFLIISSAGLPPLQAGCPNPLALAPLSMSKIKLSLEPGATPSGTASRPSLS